MPIHYQYIFHLSSYHVFPLKCCSCASDIKKEEGDCRTWRSTSKVLEKRGGAGEIRQHPIILVVQPVTQNVGLTPADCTHTSLATPLAPPHRTCTPAKGIPISFAIAPAVPQKNPTPAKSTASPPAEDLSQLQRRPIPADWNPIPFIPSLKDNAFNVVRDYVHIFPSWEDYCEDKHHFHIFLSNLRVSAIIHGYYFPVFCWLNTSMIYITLL